MIDPSLLSSLRVTLPETGLLVLVLLVLVLDLFNFKNKARLFVTISLAGLVLTLGYLIQNFTGLTGTGFSGLVNITAIDLVFKSVFLFMGFGTVMVLGLSGEESRRGESFLLVLLGLVGALFTVSSNEFITLFLSIEILSFASYLLTCFSKKSRASSEAAMKYLVLGALSSALLIFGIALIYGLIGNTQFEAIRTGLMGQNAAIVWVAFLLIFSGIAFKMGVFPFNFWIPDVYQGAPTWVGAFLSVVSKAAGFAAFVKLLSVFGVDLGPHCYTLIGLLVILTVLYGNLGALRQDNLKRFMGYSSIAQAGYLLLALTNPSDFAIRSVLFYFFVYTLSNLLVFLVIILSKKNEYFELRGLSEKSPLLAVSLFIGLTSLAGIPPMAGFVGKFMLFLSAFRADAYWPIAAALVGVLLSIYYYFRVIRVSFAQTSETALKTEAISLTFSAKIVLVLLSASIVILGLFPFPLLKILF